ncbi:MAG: ABC transporter substrate-binding protein [Phycisphaerales bacterium]
MLSTPFRVLSITLASVASLVACSCEKPAATTAPAGGAKAVAGTSTSGSSSSATPAPAGAAPAFTLAWSEYPSWSTFGVASDLGLIDGEAGKMGPIEKKYNVDIILKLTDYDTCMTMYGSGSADAVCITNMDTLNPALSRTSVAILPTSTSVGGDALIVVGIPDVKTLRGKKVYGLSKSVSEYAFNRNLEKLGEKPSDHAFTNMDPGAAAQAMQTKQPGYEAIMVWNPFVLQTLKMRPDAKVLFDSSTIPGEIIDMIVMAKSSLDKPGGKEFAAAVVEAYYEVNKRLADPTTADKTLVALGAKFSSLDLEAMKKVVQQTRFYKTPDEGIALFTGAEMPKTMDTVVDFCVKNAIVPKKPVIAIKGADGAKGTGDAATANLVFDPSFMEAARKR